MLPIVQRELRVGARDPKLYKARLRMGIVVIPGAALLLAVAQPGAAPGGGLFSLLTWLALVVCLLEGVRKTSDSISEERREGTLGLLFLTELRGLDIALGKLAGALIRSFDGLLAFIPILAITLLLGGTTYAEFWRSVLVLVLALPVSLSICLAISAARTERSAALCIGVLAALCILPLVAAEFLRAGGVLQNVRPIQAISPAGMMFLASEAAAFVTQRPFWLGVAIQCGLVILAVAFASIVAPRVWQDKPLTLPIEPPEGQAKNAERNAADEATRRAKRAKLLDRNAILWLAYSEKQHRRFNGFFMTIAVIFAVVTLIAYLDGGSPQAVIFPGFGVVVLSLILVVQMSSQASVNLAEAKRNGTLELLLSTPLKVRDIVSGQWLALRKMFVPALVTIFGFLVCMLPMTNFAAGWSNVLWLGKSFVEVGLEFFVLGWIGMWSGLVSKTPNGALFRTLVLGFFVPFLVCTPTILNQVILLAIAMDKVNVQFRRFVAERYLQDPKFVLPPPLAETSGPPVIR